VPNNLEREHRHPTSPIFRKWFSRLMLYALKSIQVSSSAAA